MMRPEKLPEQDIIDALLQDLWEDPPDQLKYELKAIPARLTMLHNRSLDRLTFLLNAILIFWGVSLFIFFWNPLEQLIIHYSGLILDYSSLTPQYIAHPLVGIIALACLITGWVWLDMETPPKTTRFWVKF